MTLSPRYSIKNRVKNWCQTKQYHQKLIFQCSPLLQTVLEQVKNCQRVYWFGVLRNLQWRPRLAVVHSQSIRSTDLMQQIANIIRIDANRSHEYYSQIELCYQLKDIHKVETSQLLKFILIDSNNNQEIAAKKLQSGSLIQNV
ncbi:Hypothetical_protein [Hexamita inflata]|uniref:Hypothetical_protein n=1 Tax=Hexamita inflata TaxID=28002 RepID=A0AA86UKV1_9EUKA|nr:Hypothetical protein HINF_LOCUS43066 [Hexamita inflata]